ncbi:MAG TPA: hypothetical protein VFR49_12665 [Solirubrobacteraceae bacterium]|nr:hypothetical protein [Solirubrobacteraceae bacterium]
MSHVIRRRLPVLAALASAGLAAGIVTGGAAPSAAAPTARTAKLAVGVEVLHFSSAGRTTTANGLLTATLSDTLGHVTTIKDNVALTAAVGGSGCRVLHLFLNELTLNLLGLTAHLDKVTLDITGNASGGVLGSLFCRLAHAKIASVRSATIAALNRGVKQQPQHALAFTAYLHPATAAAATPTATTPTTPAAPAAPAPAPAPAPAAAETCPVLDLVVGPLDLQLLGLVVDLQRVHLNVTATPGQGKLGDLFCTLADQ